MAFAKFMSGWAGRIIRIVAGLALIVVGLLVAASPWSIVLAVLGLVMAAAGGFNFCLFAPLFGGPFKGSEAV